MPCDMSKTCFHIYRIKASEDHLPKRIIVYTGVPAKYMPMAPPDLLEWVPTSVSVKPSLSFPKIRTAVRMRSSTIEEGIVNILFLETTELIFISGIFDGEILLL